MLEKSSWVFEHLKIMCTDPLLCISVRLHGPALHSLPFHRGNVFFDFPRVQSCRTATLVVKYRPESDGIGLNCPRGIFKWQFLEISLWPNGQSHVPEVRRCSPLTPKGGRSVGSQDFPRVSRLLIPRKVGSNTYSLLGKGQQISEVRCARCVR